MQTIHLLLHGDGAFEDVAQHIIGFGDSNTLRVAILERGMQSGKPSVAIGFQLERSGQWVLCQTSALAFVTAAKAILAAHPGLEE